MEGTNFTFSHIPTNTHTHTHVIFGVERQTWMFIDAENLIPSLDLCINSLQFSFNIIFYVDMKCLRMCRMVLLVKVGESYDFLTKY